MNRHNIETTKMLTRVADFAATNVGMFPKSSAGAEVQADLSAAVRDLAALSSARISSETALRSASKQRALARETLKELLMRVNRTARALDTELFRAVIKPTDHALIQSGRAFAADIEPMKKDFLKYGISAVNVTDAVGTLEQAVREYSTGTAKHATAVREFNEKLDVAMGILRRFEALVENILGSDSSVIAAWTVARTVSRVSPRRRPAKTPAVSIETTPTDKAA
jgi:cob(I)alamin adenosyltransferase